MNGAQNAGVIALATFGYSTITPINQPIPLDAQVRRKTEAYAVDNACTSDLKPTRT